MDVTIVAKKVTCLANVQSKEEEGAVAVAVEEGVEEGGGIVVLASMWVEVILFEDPIVEECWFNDVQNAMLIRYAIYLLPEKRKF